MQMELFNPAGINHKDAPPGFYPISKNEIPGYAGDNICRYCDWRPDCSAAICSCMSYRRQDGIGVIFKRRDGRES